MTKLDHVKVLDLSMFLPGPYISSCLADFGADIIKVEPPHGDPGQFIGQETQNGQHTLYRNVNRGKKIARVDLKSKIGQEWLEKKMRSADILVESFRPGVAARLGADYEAARRINPKIIYCSVSAFGQNGPLHDKPAHDLALMAMGGALSNTLGRDGFPAMPGLATADMLAALNGVNGVLIALLNRERSGEGAHIDISMHHSVMSALPNVMGFAQIGAQEPSWPDERSTGGSAFYRIYEGSDQLKFVLGAQELHFAENALAALDLTEFLPLCARGPGPHQSPLIERLEDIFSKQTRNYWLSFFEDIDMSITPVLSMDEAITHPQALARGIVVSAGDGYRYIKNPVTFAHDDESTSYADPIVYGHFNDVSWAQDEGDS